MDDHCQTLLSKMPGVVYALDEEGKFTYLSDVLQSILGYSENDLLGAHFSSIVHPEDVESVSRKLVLPRFAGIPTGSDRSPKLFDERRACSRKTSDLKVRLRGRSVKDDGEELILLCKVNAAGQYNQQAEGKTEFCGTIGIISDITQEDSTFIPPNIKKRYNVLDLLSQALSHAFSNVFTGIYGNLQLIEMHLEGKEEVVPNIDAIKNSVEKAVVLIKQMKKVISDADKEKAGLNSLVHDVTEEVFSESMLECKLSAQPTLWSMEPDPDYIRHILRSVFYYIHHNVNGPGIISVNLSNIEENNGMLPRFDCKYLKIDIALSESDLNCGNPVLEGCNEALQKISTLALSYTLLKKTGAAIEVGNSSKSSLTLYIPAVVEKSIAE